MSESNLKKVEAEVKQLREQLDSCGKYATTGEACKEYAPFSFECMAHAIST